MPQKVTIRGGAEPLLIDSTNTSNDFISLLFSSQWRSCRSWMIAQSGIGGNSFWNYPGGGHLYQTSALVTVGYGKTFPTPPIFSGLYNNGSYNTLYINAVDNPSEGQKGGFAICQESQINLCNLGPGGITMWCLILDLPSGG